MPAPSSASPGPLWSNDAAPVASTATSGTSVSRTRSGPLKSRGASPICWPTAIVPEAPSAQRIDKWLCFARVVKTRTLAARLVEAGHVRLNGVRSDNAAKMLRCGDVLTIALERQVRVLRVVADGERRGPYSEASRLFEDLGATRGDVAV